MIANHLIGDVLAGSLGPDWTIDGLAEQLLSAIAAHSGDDADEYAVDGDAIADGQARRLIRPLLACLATKSAAEAGSAADLYGGSLAFQRPGPSGPVWIRGRFENRPGCVRIALRRSSAQAQAEKCHLAGS